MSVIVCYSDYIYSVVKLGSQYDTSADARIEIKPILAFEHHGVKHASHACIVLWTGPKSVLMHSWCYIFCAALFYATVNFGVKLFVCETKVSISKLPIFFQIESTVKLAKEKLLSQIEVYQDQERQRISSPQTQDKKSSSQRIDNEADPIIGVDEDKRLPLANEPLPKQEL